MHRRPLVLTTLALLALAFVAGPALAGVTVVIPGNNPPAVNGANLLAAVGGAAPDTLIKLEPGVFDLSGQQIILPDFVDIEGSGRDITTIFSDLTAVLTPTVIDVAPGINGEIRELTVLAIANRATGITTRSDELLLTEVNLEIEGVDEAIGVRINGASPRLDEIFVRILGSNGDGSGFVVEGGGGPVLFSCLVFASNVARNAYGVLVDDSSPTIEGSILFTIFNGANTGVLLSGNNTNATVRNVRVLAQGPTSTGIQVQKQANAEIKESSFTVRSDNFSAGINLEEGTAKATESTFDAGSLFAAHLQVYGARLAGPSSFDSNASNYESTSFAVNNSGTGQARFGASQLTGNVFGAGFGSLVCVFSYRGNYTARNAVCA